MCAVIEKNWMRRPGSECRVVSRLVGMNLRRMSRVPAQASISGGSCEKVGMADDEWGPE